MTSGFPVPPETIRVLVLDDDAEDMELVVDLLQEAPGIQAEVVWAETYRDALRVLREGETDVCLVDYRLGAETGIEFMEEPEAVRSGVPMILMTGRGTPEVDSKALVAGAVDYLPKDRLSAEGLGRALRFAVERRRRQRTESLSRALIGSVQEILSILDPGTGTVRFISPSVQRVLGYRPEDRVGKRATLHVHPDDQDQLEEAFRHVVAGNGRHSDLRFRIRHADGRWRTLDAIAENHVDDPDVAGIVLSSRDVSERVDREGKIRFQANLLGAVGQAVIATDMAGCITYWNSVAESMYGWSADEAVGRSLVGLTTPQGGPSTAAEDIMRSMESTGTWSGEFEVQRKDGSTFLALVSNSLVHDDAGTTVGIIGVSSDISSLKETEAALRERVKELRVLTRTSELLNRTDLSIEEQLRMVLEGLPAGYVHPESTEARLILGDTVLATPGFRETPWTIGVAISTPEGKGQLDVFIAEPTASPPSSTSPFLPEEVEVLENVGRLIEDALKRAALQRLLTQTFSAVQEAVLVIDRPHPAREVSYVNPAAERIFGYSRHELEGQSTERLHMDRESFLRFGRESAAALREQGVFHGEYRLCRKDGTSFAAEQTVTLLDPARALEGGVVFVVRDVSERIAMEEQLRQMQKMESVGQLAGGIAHDFNNVLTVIRSQVDLVLLDLGDGPMADDLVLVRKAADRAATLTAQLLAFSREQILLPRIVELGSVVRDAGQLLDRLLGEQVQVTYRLGPDLPPVRLDPHRLEQVILNLALNARDAMPQGGALTISTFVDPPSPEAGHAAPAPTQSWVVLAVEDNGSGMSPEVARRAFDPFFTTKGRDKGTGLGLAMVYGTVKQSGGTIELESEPGAGTRFTLRFPAADPLPDVPGEAPADRTEPEPDSWVPAPGEPGFVLVIDDDDAVRRSIERILVRSGLRVVAVGDAEGGLRELTSNPHFDAVLSDLVLPGMSGSEFLERLVVERPELPLFAISGYAEESATGRDAIPPGVTFIQKPFSAQKLVAAVHAAVGRSRRGSPS